MNIQYILRKLWKNKLFTGLNILGLAIGISACWVVFRVVNYEYSFDKDHPNQERIFKVYNSTTQNGSTGYFDGLPAALGGYLKAHHPDIELVVPINNKYVTLREPEGEGASQEPFIQMSDVKSTVKDYFKMVPYQWLAGHPNKVFEHPNEVVLTASRAKQYFPKLSADQIIGKTLKTDSINYLITGVVQDLQETSSFKGKEFIPILDADWKSNDWDTYTTNFTLFLQLPSAAGKDQVLNGANKHVESLKQDKGEEQNFTSAFVLSPLKDIHFNTNLAGSTNKNLLYGMMAIGSFLLILACINFINLTTAQIPFRTKEIGIRKTLGEKPRHLTGSYILETAVTCFLAVILSWPLTKVLEKSFSTFIPKGLAMTQDIWMLIGFLVVLLVFIVLITSLYPSYLANHVQVIDVLKQKGNGNQRIGSFSFRKILIIFQFVIAQIFVVCSVVISAQLRHLIQADLGFNQHGIISIDLPTLDFQDGKVDPFLIKNSLKTYKEIKNSSLGHLPMNNSYWGSTFFLKSDTGKVQKSLEMKYIDENYADVFGIQVIAGRNLSLSDTSNGVMFTARAIREFGFKSPQEAIGMMVENNDKPYTIVGVLNDFSNQPLRQNPNPIVFFPSMERGKLNTLTVQLSDNPQEWQTGIKHIESEWHKYYPNAAFKYEFYDARVANFYNNDRKFESAINVSGGICILLGCLGLIGLVTVSTTQRNKEIGIRKVLGSSVFGIVKMLSKDYIILVFISIVIATPIGYWLMHKWLKDYAYKIEFNAWIFILPAILTLIIAFITMSFQSIRAARANPVNSLRDE